ncbi:hypothetical protein ACIQNU_16690 [Streptomyces sp. NPDC091292]|uniref:hypothetical protein n=1 Tax=Streptomyces sp. NPDC091292 TaxID=3365991 RepID=UPI003802CE3A
MTGPHHDEEPAEHLRFARWLSALETVAEADEADLVAAVLRDPDANMAESAVGRHLDRRAAEMLTDPRFTTWARTLADVIAERHFPARRLGEWSLLRAITLGEPWAVEDLLGATDWCQRMVPSTAIPTAPDALELLAERGRTRRIRVAAGLRLRQVERSS